MVEALKILVVSSRSSARKLSLQYLKMIEELDGRRISLKAAKSCDHVLRALVDYAPDVVVVDTEVLVEHAQSMYIIPGFDLCRGLKHDHPDIPVIALYDNAAYRDRCESADAVICKDCESLSDSALEAVLKNIMH